MPSGRRVRCTLRTTRKQQTLSATPLKRKLQQFKRLTEQQQINIKLSKSGPINIHAFKNMKLGMSHES